MGATMATKITVNLEHDLAFPVFVGSPVLPSAAVSVDAFAQRTPLRSLTAAADEIRAMIASHLGAAAVLPRSSSPSGAVA